MRPDPTSIKSRLSIAAALRARGLEPKDNRMPCPIHRGGNRSSFSIKGEHARCWACGWHGDVIALVQAIDGLGFSTALARCAEAAGLIRPRVWERKPWLDREADREAARLERHERVRRYLTRVRWYARADELADAEREVAGVTAAFTGTDVDWALLSATHAARDLAELRVDEMRGEYGSSFAG